MFCGCGGFSKGFSQAGFDVRLGIDQWKDATTTFKHNFPNSTIINDDITKISTHDILSKTGLTKDDVDVIIGGPPCQGFSLSGKRMLDDPRNKLYKSFVEIVGEIKPKVFVMENVPGLIRLFNGKVKNEVISDFSELGYNVQMKLLSADWFGVPQQRKRVFFVGINTVEINNKNQFVFPVATHGKAPNLKPYVTCKEAISDLDFVADDEALPECINYELPAQSD